ncbi:MAG: serine/threonine protein kinase [Deltaproteobacteria bacterium]|nr:MAG: serine/threonine protein kinase [Deltaproteobacteria bacterium]
MYPRPYANYTLLEQLATGGMSQVDLARRSVDDAGYVRFLVVKRIRANHVEDESFVRMFKDEARITSELRHTHIAQVYDFGRVGEEYYLALEYVPGTDLRVILSTLRQRRERMPVRMALRIMHDVLDALQYAHTRTDAHGRSMNIVHRDVNPRNIMVSISGEVKLIDFGVARASDRLERTQTDHFKGKVAYMAPEQISGGDALDHRVDLFAIGLTLYEMLVGAGPFAGMDQTQILFRIMQGRIPSFAPPRDWGESGRALAQVVNKALRADPDDRYPDADTMRRAVYQVAEAFGGLPTTAELREWLHALDPDLEPRVRQKMESWSGPIPLGRSGDPGSDEVPFALDASGTMDARAIPPGDSSGSGTVTRTMVLTGVGMATALLIGGGAILAVVLLVVGLIYLPPLLSAEPDAQATAEVNQAPPEPDPTERSPARKTDESEQGAESDGSSTAAAQESSKPAKPSSSTPPAPSVTAPKTAPEQRTPPPARSTSSASPRVAPETPSQPAVSIIEEPSPTPSPSIVEIPSEPEPEPELTVRIGASDSASTPKAPEPAPPPEPEPEPAEPGKLTILSGNRGVPVFIDGKKTPYKTGDQFDWPSGDLTITADGHEPAKVTLHPRMSRMVRLSPK